MNISSISIKNPVFTTMMMAALVVLGTFSYQRLSIDEYPDVSIPIISVQTVYPGAGPEAVEREVSRTIEEALNTVEGVDLLTSTSLEGVSLVVAEFDLDVDDNVAAQDVRSKLDQIRRDLPLGVEPPVVEKFDPSAKPIISLALSSDTESLRDLTALAGDVVKPRLEGVAGVASAEVVGGTEREIHVNLLPDRMVAMGVGVADVRAALERQNVEVPAGRLTRGSVEELVRVIGRFERPEEFGHVIVAVRNEAPVYLDQVARIDDATEEARSVALVDGKRSVAVDVRKVSGSNTVEVAELVREAIAELKAEAPSEVEIRIVQDNSTFIEHAVKDVKIALLIGAILTVIIVFLFLGDWRATTITALALPVSVISAFIIMDFMGFTLNTMTLMGLSLSIGILIDDAIVVIENIVRHKQEGKPIFQAAEDATKQIGLAVSATTFTIVAVFLPVAFMEGLVGKFFYEFGITVAWAVLISLFVSFTLTPMLAAHWSEKGHKPKRRPGEGRRFGRWIDRAVEGLKVGVGRLGERYENGIALALDHRGVTVAIAVGALVGALALFPFIGGEFMTSSDRGFFWVPFETPPGASLEFSERKAGELEGRIRDLPGVAYTYATIGGGLDGSVERGEILVRLVAKGERKLSQVELMDLAREALRPVHGVTPSVLEAGKMGSVEKPLQVKLRGPELDRLTGLSETLAREIRQVPGAIEVETSLTGAKPEYQVNVRRELAAEIGLTVGQIAAAVRPAVAGEDVTLWEAPNGETYDVVMRLPEEFRRTRENLERIPVASVLRNPATNGWFVMTLDHVADVQAGSGPTRFEREGLQRVVTVSANVGSETDLKSLSSGVRSRLVGIDLPPEYSTYLAGETQDFEETVGSVGMALLLSVILIYMILASQFGSFTHPLGIMMALPLSLVGVFLALLLTGDTVNIMSMIGLILLMGLVTKNAILLVDFTNELRGQGKSRREALLMAGRLRLRPILMTALSTIFGVLPVALALGEGSEFRAPMARAVIGGMTTSTLLTLVIVPVIYTYVDDLDAWVRMRLRKRGDGMEPASDGVRTAPTPAA